MIYIKNTTEIQTIFIPRNELQKEAYITSTKTYEDGYREGLEDGKEYQKDQLLNLYVTENGQYEREDGWGVVTVDIPIGECPDCPEGGSCNLEDKWLTPSMGDRDDNGYVIANPSEGFDGLSRVVIDPTTIYNEGVSAGKAEGGDLNVGTGDIFLSVNDRGQRFEILPSEWGYDAFDKFIVEMENFDLGGDANIYDALSVNQLLMDGTISYGNVYIFKGEITEIQRIRPEYGDARYTLDGSLNVHNGQTMGYDLQVGDNVIVIGTLSEYNGAPQLSAGSMIKAWWRSNCDDAYNSGYNQGYYDATSFDKIAMEIETDVYSKLEFLTDRSFVTTSGDNSPKSLMFDMPINYIWSYRDVNDGIAELRQNAFRDYSKIRKVKLETIMTLGERAFKDAFELTEIEMSSLVGYIATEAFDGCSKLAKIICRATDGVLLGSTPFNGLPENGVLYLEEGVDETPWLTKLPNGWVVERL
jgi:hypothetical protein